LYSVISLSKPTASRPQTGSPAATIAEGRD